MQANDITPGSIFWYQPDARDGEAERIPHPHVVVAVADDGALTLCALTTNLHRVSMPGNVLLNEGEALLPKRSVVEVSKRVTVSADRLGAFIGTLDEHRVRQIRSGIQFVATAFVPRGETRMNDTQSPIAQALHDILKVFDETFETVIGVYLDRGTSLFETLATITAAEASLPVSATCAALSAQVDHLRFYLDVMQDVMLGREQESYDWKDIWNRVGVVTDDEWAAIQARLRESHRQIRALLVSPQAQQRPEAIGVAAAVIAHSAYHLGEIRQALCTLRPV